jgi:phage-related protein (TIGR01555 family)
MTDKKPGTIASVVNRIDGWLNQITGLGTSRDKRTSNLIKPVLPTVDFQTLDDLFHGDDMAQIIAGKAPEDMVRKWIELTVELGDPGLSEGESEVSDDMLQALNDLDAKGAYRAALTWANVFGGALIFIGADDGGGSDEDALAKPLNEDRIRSVEFLEVFDRFDVQIKSEYADKADLEKFGKPKTYEIVNYQGTHGATLSNVEIHESRFLRFDGPLTSKRRIVRNNGWNDSVYTKLLDVLSDFGSSWGGVAALLQDFAQAIFKMKGLADIVGSDADNIVQGRMQTMDLCRSVMRMIPIDAELEDFERVTTPVSGLAELMDRLMLRMSAAAQMPVTILFGISPAGLNTTAEGDLSIWDDRVSSKQEIDLRPRLTRLIELLFKAADGPTKGKEPEGWEYSFNPLRQPTEKEAAEARKIQMETDTGYIDTNVLEPDEVAQARFGGESYSFETTLDKEARAAEIEEPEPEPVAPPVPPVPPAVPVSPVPGAPPPEPVPPEA